MQPDHAPRFFSVPMRFLLSACLLGLMVLTADYAAAQPPGVDHRRGQAAIDRLGARLPAVAARHNMAAARLRELFLTDPYIAVDEADNLLFIDEFVPEDAGPSPAETIGTGTGPLDLAKTFLLHSLPGATKVIYLDFDGHTTTGTLWNTNYGATIVSAPYSVDGNAAFSSGELTNIQYIWQRVAEDYLPYGVDVTTQDPGLEALRKSGPNDVAWGQRVVISPTNWYNTGAGGVAYVGAFSWDSDTPCFVFTAQLGNGNEKYTAEAAAHEAGHTVGLYHDGVAGGSAYYTGHNGWAPIMGVGYNQTVVQWSKGEYPNANNTEDDLTIMTGYGFTFRPDDHGNTAAGATPLVVTNSTSVSGSGIIERPTDKDAFSFQAGAGAIALNVTSPARSPNLNIRADLYDSVGVIMASSSPTTSLSATITYNALASGTFTLVVDGVGNGDLVTGYSDYGSLGEYSISGTIVSTGVPQAPVAAASASPTDPLVGQTVTFSSAGSTDPDGQIASYSWDFGDGSALDGRANPTHTYAAKRSYTATLTVTDNAGFIDTATVVITVVGPPATPGNLTATAVSSSQINLAWADQSDDETGFEIERSSGGGTWSLLTTVGTNVSNYSNTGLAASTTYQYRVKAVNNAGGSGYTNIASATTQAASVALHVGDLDGSRSISKKNWTAKVTITVHDASHAKVSGALVSGTWSTGGSGSCTTSSRGTCTVSASGLSLNTTSTTFSVTGVSKSGTTYAPTANHDPDGGSDGTTIVVLK